MFQSYYSVTAASFEGLGLGVRCVESDLYYAVLVHARIACLIVTVDRDGDVHSGDTGPEWNYRAGDEPPSLHALRKIQLEPIRSPRPRQHPRRRQTVVHAAT